MCVSIHVYSLSVLPCSKSPLPVFQRIRHSPLAAGGNRMAKTHSLPYLHRSISANKPYDQWLLCELRPATQGILCIFATL